MATVAEKYDKIKSRQRSNGVRKGHQARLTPKQRRENVKDIQTLSLAAYIVDYYLEHTPARKLCDDSVILEGVVLRFGHMIAKRLRQMRDEIEPAPVYEFWSGELEDYLKRY